MKKDLIRDLIYRYFPDGRIEGFEDVMIVEEAFDIFLDGKYYKSIACTPSFVDELLIGHLAQDGKINGIEDLGGIELNDNEVYIELCRNESAWKQEDGKIKDISCPAGDIVDLMQIHLKSSDLHRLTGGVHVMSLAYEGQLIISREDIGRHNAVDKVFGYCLKNKIDCQDKIFFSSGRLTYDIILKIINMGVKIVVSRAAVSSKARELALQSGITAIGFARGDRFNIYSCPQRIITGNSR